MLARSGRGAASSTAILLLFILSLSGWVPAAAASVDTPCDLQLIKLNTLSLGPAQLLGENAQTWKIDLLYPHAHAAFVINQTRHREPASNAESAAEIIFKNSPTIRFSPVRILTDDELELLEKLSGTRLPIDQGLLRWYLKGSLGTSVIRAQLDALPLTRVVSEFLDDENRAELVDHGFPLIVEALRKTPKKFESDLRAAASGALSRWSERTPKEFWKVVVYQLLQSDKDEVRSLLVNALDPQLRERLADLWLLSQWAGLRDPHSANWVDRGNTLEVFDHDFIYPDTPGFSERWAQLSSLLDHPGTGQEPRGPQIWGSFVSPAIRNFVARASQGQEEGGQTLSSYYRNRGRWLLQQIDRLR